MARRTSINQQPGNTKHLNTSRVAHLFLFIALPTLHNYNVEMPQFLILRFTEDLTFLSLSEVQRIWFLGIQL